MSPTDFDVLADLRRQLSGKSTLWTWQVDEIVTSVSQRLSGVPPETAIDFSLTGLRLMRQEKGWLTYVLNRAIGSVLRRKLQFTEDQVVEMIELVSLPDTEFPFKGVLKAAESLPLAPRIAGALVRLRPCISEYLGGGQMRDLHARIDNLLSGPAPDTSLEVQGAWSKIVFQEIAGSPQRRAWESIFSHAAELKSSEAPKKWRAVSNDLVEKIGRKDFLEAAGRWLLLGPSPDRSGPQISSGEAELQKGFIWFLAGEPDERLPGLLAGFAEAALKKIPLLGAVSQKVGNACVNVLAELPGLEPVSQLSRLAQRVRYDTAQRLIEEALVRAAEKAGVSRDELEEMSIPDYGLGPEGKLTRHFGEHSLEVAIEETTSAAVRWADAQGKPLRSAPACVKQHHAEEWKHLQARLKEMEKMLAAQRMRLERLLLTQRAIPVATLRTCYLEHPLLAEMSRRLIWQFESGPGIWHDGRMVDDTEREIDWGAQKTARLWHPVSSKAQAVLHWRCWLEDHRIRQPFKQAHREVYLLTDAERQTRTFSNRFAGHILRQHQFAALCEQRGWTYRLMGQWDSHNTPELELPRFGLQAQYEVDFPENEHELSGHGIYLLVRTAAVRFSDCNRVPQPLESIPPAVFSEVMRDLDLFTGVSSIGADPAWGERRPFAFQEYWENFAAGEMTEMALSRRSVLERLLPRLAIRDRCRIEGRYLLVRGDRARYRIHLGSKNVRLESGPYLCIVEGPATRAVPRNVFLPFEGDRTLSLILSKAFLLADDRKIKDPAILRQLPPGTAE